MLKDSRTHQAGKPGNRCCESEWSGIDAGLQSDRYLGLGAPLVITAYPFQLSEIYEELGQLYGIALKK
jgi:hypothetical protein